MTIDFKYEFCGLLCDAEVSYDLDDFKLSYRGIEFRNIPDDTCDDIFAIANLKGTEEVNSALEAAAYQKIMEMRDEKI